MKETNKHILIEAINNLPQHEPKPKLWDIIDMELTKEKQEVGLKNSIRQLPNYDPPAQLWDEIEAGLDQDTKQEASVFSLRRWASVAAVFVAVSIGAWLLYSTNTTSGGAIVSVSYSEENIASSFFNTDWDNDEDAFAMVAEFCKTEQMICKQPDFKILTAELDELNAARIELKDAMDNYGKDPELIAQLTSIEHERSDLLKQIIKRI